MEFLDLKNFIKSNKQHGDIMNAARNIGCCSQLYLSAMRREKPDELTDMERQMLEEMLRIVKERIRAIKQLKEVN